MQHSHMEGPTWNIFQDLVVSDDISRWSKMNQGPEKWAAYQDTFCNGNILEAGENVSEQFIEVPFFEEQVLLVSW